jgi:hypothetical protein
MRFALVPVVQAVVIQISSQDWDYRARTGLLRLRSEDANTSYGGTSYSGQMIQHIAETPANCLTCFEILRIVGGRTVDVFDYRERHIAQFSSEGYAAVLDRAYGCAGLE